MKLSSLRLKLSVFMVVFALGVTASPAFSQEKGKAKAKDKQKTGAKEKHGREAGEMPLGLVRHTDKKGELPSGLQKKKDEDGQLTHGLEEGGKKFKPSSKGKQVGNK